VVTLIGDASIVNGVAMEGSTTQGRFRGVLVVLNDNGCRSAGRKGVAQYFDRLRMCTVRGLQEGAKRVLSHVRAAPRRRRVHKAGEATKA